MFGFGSLLALPVLVAYWVGVISLGKSGRNVAWWCMMIGMALSTLGMLGSLVSMGIMFSGFRTGGGVGSTDSRMVLMMVISGIGGIGSLLFAIGFAMYGLKSRRASERTEELERVLEAQQEQISRQEGQG